MRIVSNQAAPGPGQALEFRSIAKTFGARQVLKGVSLDIRPGEFMTLLGPSGCGKSTMLRIAAGLETPSGGEILIGSRPVGHLPPKDRGVAMVFQNYALYPHMTAFHNIATPLRMSRQTLLQRLPVLGRLLPGARQVEAQIREDVVSAGRVVGLDTLLDRKPGQLSGGQRQRVALGRAIVRRPAVFLMDEPLSNLDATLRAQMRLELARLHQSVRATFVYVTHDQLEAMTLSDRVAVVMDGTILQVGTPDAVYSTPAHLDVARFVGSPAINVLPGHVGQDRRIDAYGIVMSGVAELTPGTPLQIAIRAEDIELAAPGQSAWNGVILHVENLGADFLLHCVLNDKGAPCIVRAPRRSTVMPATGESVWLRPAGPMHIFSDDGRQLALPRSERDLVRV